MTLIYMHVPKTGGMSINKALGATFLGVSKTGGNYDEGHQEAVARLEGKAEVVSGHFPYGAHTMLIEDYDYCTMLRHPVERIMSMYLWIRKQHMDNDGHPGRDAARDYGLSEFPGQYWRARNGAVRQLSGMGLGWSGPVESTHYQQALKHLEACKHVGVLRRAQAFLDEVTDGLGRERVAMPHVNSVSNSYYLDLHPDQQAAIINYNLWDMRLYDRALELAAR